MMVLRILINFGIQWMVRSVYYVQDVIFDFIFVFQLFQSKRELLIRQSEVGHHRPMRKTMMKVGIMILTTRTP